MRRIVFLRERKNRAGLFRRDAYCIPANGWLPELFLNLLIRPISLGFDDFSARDPEVLQRFKTNPFACCGNPHANAGVYPLKQYPCGDHIPIGKDIQYRYGQLGKLRRNNP